MPANSKGQKTDGPNRASNSAETTNHEHTAGYGDDALWPNVVWTVIGILSVVGLAVFLLMR